MKLEPISLGPNWWTSLHHTGLLIAPRVVEQFFSDDLPPLPAHAAETLRRSVTLRAEIGIGPLLDTVFLSVLGYDSAQWNRNPSADKWSHRLVTGESERPRRVYADSFPIFVEKPDVRLGLGRGRQSVARVVEWLRKANLKLGLLATENQWRLIYAGSDFDASCEWNLDLWFEAGQPALQVEALRRLLGLGTVPDSLITAIQDSRRGEAELSSELGENARKAIEKLVQASAENLENLNVLPPDIYLAATRMIMRCVVALFAEGKGMLGRDLPRYHDSYGIQGLREQLERARFANLHETQFAWPRLVSLFRLIYTGSGHPEMSVTRYGGALFEPGDSGSDKPVLRAIAAFEKTDPCPNDREVYEILALLTRTYLNIRQGRTTRAIATPVDFSSLDTEYIGILYEGLLDYELKRATEPVVFVRMGDEPALPISQLETIAPAKLKDVFGKLKKKSQLAVSEEDNDDEEDSEISNEPEDDEKHEETAVQIEANENVDESDASIARAHQWASEAVKAAKLVPRPRSQRAEALRKYEEGVAAAAKNLFSRVVRPGDWYLVRFGNTRKGSGTFYTRKELAGPTVRRTLQPLVYEVDATRKPEEILALKVCDPACGSGSFLISAIRYLTEALFQSLYQHNRIQDAGNHTKLYDLGVRKEDLPTTEDFDDQLRARLRRHVVERCLYGVDLNPLAVELARMSLWIETLDPRLPFGFLDHKLKVGNALVGCWFDRFEDYPAMAWNREGGDKDYEPVNSRTNWTKAIAARFREHVKPSLVNMIGAGQKQQLLWEGETPADIAKRARERLLRVHEIGVHDPDEQRTKYNELRADPAFQRLLTSFNLWCALWFWPVAELERVPLAKGFVSPILDAEQIAAKIAEDRHYRFFHWELEFPDVFNAPGTGFDAVIGNPPWEIQKPNSKEFFSNIDPLYRGYGKQEALSRQKEYFKCDARHEELWINERARIKALANWVKYTGIPFGDQIRIDSNGKKSYDLNLGRSFAKSGDLHRRWALMREGRSGYTDAQHPFVHQGSADLNTYKMFLEQAYRLLRPNGRLGMIVPSGVYSDQGSTDLRNLFLDQSQWEWLFSFENRDGIFDIHRSFKFNPLIVQKGGQTEAIQTAFMLHNPKDWDEAERYTLAYPGERVKQFSPGSKALLEFRSNHELQTVSKLYSGQILLGERSGRGWNLQYTTDFHMTNDSDKFVSRPALENAGYRPDEYGHWLKGSWRSYTGPNSIVYRKRDLVLSNDGSEALLVDDIEDVALPLYQGVMMHQFDCCAKGWVSGTGLRAKWAPVLFPTKLPRPQYLVRESTFRARSEKQPAFRVAFRGIGRATDERTFIAASIPQVPASDMLPMLLLKSVQEQVRLAVVTNSFVFDWIERVRQVSSRLSFFIIAEQPILSLAAMANPKLDELAAQLQLFSPIFARSWLALKSYSPNVQLRFAMLDHERLRIRAMLDAVCAFKYGLAFSEFRTVLDACDYPESAYTDDTILKSLDAKGFWRVDKEKPPHLRHTVLSLVAFHELERIGVDAFLALNDGEGWMLPEALRLADYGLGHDDRAKEHQPVASVLGPRFYDWQLSQSVEESWEECERHAELLNKIVPPPAPEQELEPEQPQALLAF